MNFPQTMDRLAASEETHRHPLTDGRFTVTYGETAQIFEGFDRRFERSGVTREQCLAFECSQSVSGALALLYLLARGYDLVLLPQLGEQSKESKIPRFIPNFCPHVVSTLQSDPGEGDGGLEIAANPDYLEDHGVARSGPPVLYLRTSGSTSAPKMARMTHQKWLDNAQACVERWRLTPGDRLAIPVPIFHSYGFGAAFLPGLLAGASMDLQSSINILRYLEREKRFDPNVAFLTPALADQFLRVRKSRRAYRFSVTAGDKVKEETIVAFEPRFGPLLDLYGSAEMGAVSSAAPEDPLALRRGTAGRPLAGIELRLEEIESDAGQQAAGLLCCRQRNGFAGYLSQEGDGWRFQARSDEEWFPTGDLAEIRDDGYVKILGRSGLSVKRDGLLVVFADVEAVLSRLPGIERAAVFSKGESQRGRRLIAACQTSSEETIDAPTIRKTCFEHLPVYAVPDEVVVVDSLPLLPNGKINRRALPGLT